MKQLSGLTLLIPDKHDSERESVAAAWTGNGGVVLRIGRFWDPPPMDANLVRVYGNDSFAQVLAQKIGLNLISPADDLILILRPSHLKRDLESVQLSKLEGAEYPAFLKPLSPKLFRAAIFQNWAEVQTETKGLPSSTGVLKSEVVRFISEARFFILGQEILDCALYEGLGDLSQAREFVGNLIRENSIPKAVVIDVGLIDGKGWSVVEFNAAWGAGLNGCDAEKVWPVIAAATEMKE